MPKNVIVLTHGLSGSSLLTGLIARADYWLGQETMKKKDYDTYENQQLIDLNIQLLQSLGYDPDIEYSPAVYQQFLKELPNKLAAIDLSPYREFVQTCQQNQPWAWKDPRLTWTIHVWHQLLPMDEIELIILSREPLQAWITYNQRRHIESYAFTKRFIDGMTGAVRDFAQSAGKNPLTITFEDILLRPDAVVGNINVLLDSELSVDDLKAVSNIPFGKKSRGFKDFIMASLIYLKNYHLRRA